LVADGKMDIFGGSLVDYASWLKEWRAKQDVKVESTATREEKRQERQEANHQATTYTFYGHSNNKPKSLKRSLQRLNEQQALAHSKLEDSSIYQDSNKDKLKKLLVKKQS
jgi:ATP-binding cassette subfamily F protein 3